MEEDLSKTVQRMQGERLAVDARGSLGGGSSSVSSTAISPFHRHISEWLRDTSSEADRFIWAGAGAGGPNQYARNESHLECSDGFSEQKDGSTLS